MKLFYVIVIGFFAIALSFIAYVQLMNILQPPEKETVYVDSLQIVKSETTAKEDFALINRLQGLAESSKQSYIFFSQMKQDAVRQIYAKWKLDTNKQYAIDDNGLIIEAPPTPTPTSTPDPNATPKPETSPKGEVEKEEEIS